MAPSTPASRRDEIARIAALLRGVALGTVARGAVAAITRELWPPGSGQGTPFSGNGTASVVFDSIWNIEETHDDGYVLRNSDLEQFSRWLLEGNPAHGTTRIAWVKGTPADLARGLGVTTVRYWVDGLGWHESFSFASPYTGRCFIGEAPMVPVAALHVVDIIAYAPADIALLHDLFDTLGIDIDDLFQPPDLSFKRWSLWRQDDNGVRALVASYTGRVKAETALSRFEALGHKQSYWLENPPETG
jgi:hypothetical protein